jgi:hypothetical protein
MVYFPALTPSNFSSSDWSTHCKNTVVSACSAAGEKTPSTHLAGEVELNGLDTNILRAFRHCGGRNYKS